MACDPSVDPLSAISTSPAIPASFKALSAFSTHTATVSASLRQGITTDSSSSASPGAVSTSTRAAVMKLRFPRLEASHEVERTTEESIGESRIQTEIGLPVLEGETERHERLPPALLRPVVVRQRHAVPGVSDPVHQRQRGAREDAVQTMIFDHDRMARDA